MMLSLSDFETFFQEVHGHSPFPWQKRLLEEVAEQGRWRRVLDLPTGSGKTAAIDIAIFHLALEARDLERRRAPVRIAFVVDRRLVVDDAFERSRKIAAALNAPDSTSKPVTARVAASLKRLAIDGQPLLVRRMRGGLPREDDWARSPSQPTVLCSTVDQLGSRLLFRGYGVSHSMKPVQAGLIGSDCLILLDEAHLAEPFRQTLEQVDVYRGTGWRASQMAAPWGMTLLTATPGDALPDPFSLDDDDKSHPILKKRLEASKPARLVNSKEENDTERVLTIQRELLGAVKHFKDVSNGAPRPVIGIVVNRVARARAVFAGLVATLQAEIEEGSLAEPILLIGPARPVDRNTLAQSLEPIRTRAWKDGEARTLAKSLIVVATQCIEAGVDIDLDALITEVAPLDSLRQRFGRLNRAGRDIVPYAAIIATKSDIAARADDPVYGKSSKETWSLLVEAASHGGKDQVVDFGISQFSVPLKNEALSPRECAPVLLPAHLDLLSQTSPIPAADPEVGLYLHGASLRPDSITVVWRADVDPEWKDQDIVRLLTLAPPRSLEAIELPVWAVHRWLERRNRATLDIADVPSRESDEQVAANFRGKLVFRWRGNEQQSGWISSSAIQPGDSIVVPARYGGVDEFGWDPNFETAALDVGQKAAQAFAGRRFALRVAPGLLGKSTTPEALATALCGAESGSWRDLSRALLSLNLPLEMEQGLHALQNARKQGSVTASLDIYGFENKRPRGVVFLAPYGIKSRGVLASQEGDGRPNSTEDDTSGSLYGFPLSLEQHSHDVEETAGTFAMAAGLPADRCIDMKVAGFLHDQGKRDVQFQGWLHYGDPLGFDPDDESDVLAKSGRTLPPSARSAVGLPPHWRHEALSVSWAPMHERFREARDPDLVLWLVGSHHGYGRPFFPHKDHRDGVLGVGPQSLAFDWNGLDWPSLFVQLKARYGVWELARMEAIIRLADHRASEDACDRILRESNG
jgi:CRISPR-associated endonuclease/helicase Cas3